MRITSEMLVAGSKSSPQAFSLGGEQIAAIYKAMRALEPEMEICAECGGAGGDNQHTICGKCNGTGGIAK